MGKLKITSLKMASLLMMVFFALSGQKANADETLTLTVANGSYTTTTNNYINEWTSNTTPVITISASANNMDRRVTSDYFLWHSGTALSGSYTFTIGSGYRITGWTLTGKGNSAEQVVTPNDGDQVTFTTDEEATAVVTEISAKSSTFVLSGANSGLQVTEIVISYKEETAFNRLQDTYEELFPNGETVADLFEEGTASGQVPSEYYQALVSAHDTAIDLLNQGEEDADASACEAAATALRNAFEAAEANIFSLEPGYYLMRLNPAGGGSYTETSYAYSDGNFGLWNSGFDKGAALSDADVAYIWKLDAVAGVDNGFTLYNFGTQNYLGVLTNFSQKIPMAEEGHTYIIKPQSGYSGFFTIARDADINSGLHGAVSGYAIVNYYITYNSSPVIASGWTFEKVSDEDIEALEEAAEKNALTLKMQQVASEAAQAIADGYVLTKYVSDADHIWTNAQEPTEGPIANAVDNNYGTFFHSAWSVETSVPYHNICAELSEAVDQLTIQIVRRMGASTNASPKDVIVYASNDVTNGDTDGEGWVEIGNYTFEYDTDVVYNGTTYANYLGHIDLTLPEKYKFIRFDVTSTVATTSGTNLYFHCSEIAFVGDIDEENSPINMMDATIVQALRDALTNAQTELDNDACTQETYDALVAALEAFNANVPDIAALKQLLAEVKAYVESMEEGTDIGYFTEGAKAAAEMSIAEVEDAMTNSKLNVDKVEELSDRLANIVFNTQDELILPTNGEYYRIVCKGSSSDGNYLYATGNGETTIMWKDSKEDADKAEKLQYLWRAIVNDEGDIAYQNAFTGEYMGTYTGSSASAAITMSEEPDYIQMEYAGTGGQLYFVQEGEDSDGDNFVANTQPTGSLVTWYTGDANSYFSFQEASAIEWEGAQYLETGDNNAHIFTLPFDVAYADGAVLYQVIGILNGATLELEAIDEVEAGTPFIAVSELEDGFYVYLNASNTEELKEVEYATGLSAVNGLVGVLGAYEAEGGEGKLADGIIKQATAGETIGPNTGYLLFGATPKTDSAGDLSIDLDEAIKTGIAQAVTDALNGKKVIYDLSGRRVNNAEKGVFIINGKKVIR